MSLCTLDDVKYFYGIAGTNDETDTLLEDLIGMVSKTFETYCDRVFDSATYTDDFDGDRKMITLDHYPIISVTSVTDRGEDWTGSTLVSGTYYKISNNSRHILFNSSATLTRYTENVRIVYVAGYATIPYDLKLACMEEVVKHYISRKRVNVLDESKGEHSLSFSIIDFLPTTLTILKRYMNKGVV